MVAAKSRHRSSLTTTWKASVRLAPAIRPLPGEVFVPAPSFTSRRFIHEPPRPSKEVVLAVGMHAIVRSHGEGLGKVSLSDEDGTATLGTLKDGVEVEITAWRPRRGAGALYRVRATGGGKEGWVNGSSLEPMPRPRERPAPQPAPASSRAKTSSPKPRPRSRVR
jgi:hypothetical protein